MFFVIGPLWLVGSVTVIWVLLRLSSRSHPGRQPEHPGVQSGAARQASADRRHYWAARANADRKRREQER